MQHKRQKQYHHNREEDETQQGSKSRNRIPSRKWSEKLPQDIMQSILQRLCTSDYLRCRAVCHSWRSAALDLAMSARKLGCHLAPQLPWLLFPTRRILPKLNITV